MASRQKHTEITEGPSAARRFEGTLDRLLRVSKEELTRREVEYQESRKERGPKPGKK